MMPAVAGPATTSASGSRTWFRTPAGDFDAGVVQQQLTAVDVPGDGAARGQLEFAAVQVLGDQSGQLVKVLERHPVHLGVAWIWFDCIKGGGSVMDRWAGIPVISRDLGGTV